MRRALLLSDRLQSLLDDVLPGLPMADVGTDHGLLPIAAIEQGLVPNAIAADLRPEPLSLARANVRARGLSHSIDVRLGDGLAPLTPQDNLATVTIAGMGGSSILGILQRVEVRTLGVQRLALQVPQQAAQLRRGLVDMGFGILHERLLCFEGRTYTNMRVDPNQPTDTQDWEEADWLMGREPRQQNSETFQAWCATELARYRTISQGLQKAREPDAEKIAQVARAITLFEKALTTPGA